MDALVEPRGLEVRPRIASGLLQLDQYVLHRRQTQAGGAEQPGRQPLEQVAPPHQLRHRQSGVAQYLLDQCVGLRMHAGHVQRVVAAANAQKARALLEALGSEAGHLEQLLAVAKAAIGVAPAHQRCRDARRQARHPAQQRHAGGVEVDAHRIDAVLDHGVKAARELALVEVMLVLSDANGLGVDLDEFGQRVLQAPGNARSAAQADIDVGHLLRGKCAGRINRGAGLADDHLLGGRLCVGSRVGGIGCALRKLAQQLSG